jgi:transcription-repair coupling factor (superfamily II helicase)
MWTISGMPETPDSPMVTATGWGPVVGDGEGLTARLRELLANGYRVVVAADGEGSAERMSSLMLDRGLSIPVVGSQADLTRPGGYVAVAPLHRGCTVSAAKLAIVAEADLTGRRRAHRQARPRKRQGTGLFEDLKPGNYVVHHQHGVGQYQGMVKRTIGGVERDYLLLRTRAATSCMCRATRSTRCASTSAARHPCSTGSAAPISRRRRTACAAPFVRSRRSWSCCTRSG